MKVDTATQSQMVSDLKAKLSAEKADNMHLKRELEVANRHITKLAEMLKECHRHG